MLQRLHVPVVAFVATTLLASCLTALVHQYERGVNEAHLERELSGAVNRIEASFLHIDTILETTRAFLSTRTMGEIPRQRFVSYYQSLANSGMLKTVHGLGYIQIVTPENTEHVAARIREAYGPEHRLWPEANPANDMRTAVVLIEPGNNTNLSAIGFDMYSDQTRADAMRRAMSTRRSTQTAPMQLMQSGEDELRTGTLIGVYMEPSQSGESTGFVYAPISMEKMFADINAMLDQRVALKVYDAELPELLLFKSASFPETRESGQRRAHYSVKLSERVWEFEVVNVDAAGLLGRKPLTLMAGLAALVLGIAVSVAVQGMSAAHRNVRKLNAIQSQRLHDKDVMLQEMKHRLKNMLARVVAIARQAARHSNSKEELVESLTGRLQAMANAQDLLTRSVNEGASLRRLIESEMRQISGGDESRAPVIDGPEIYLDAQQTQALGLTIHELATNALKYGAGSTPEGQMEIGWDIGQGVLTIVWDEEVGQPIDPQHRTGFGTRLIDGCIRIELGGTVERVFRAQGLTIILTIPMPDKIADE